MRDVAVQDIVDDVVARDPQLKKLQCTAIVKGGVVHVHGSVPAETDRRHLRRMLARLRGVNGIWDTIRVEGNGELKVVDLGCGGAKQMDGAIGVDAHPHPGVDIVTDMENGLPFRDREIDYIFAVHFLEHIRDLVGLMNEIHRVLKPGGALHAMVPNAAHANAIADPTHVRYFNCRTFRYFCEQRPNILPFRPVCISQTEDDVLADLQPVTGGEPLPDDKELALFFS